MLRGVWQLLIAVSLALVFAAGALAGWAGSDPAKNYPLGKLPLACSSAPTGKACVDAGVYYLDKARATLGLPAYKLPADFPSLTPAQQVFILTNLDRIQYGLPPIAGLTAALNHDALTSGVQPAMDPWPTDQSELEAWTANWAGGYDNAVMAYEGWVYDDGLGSGNLDCTANDQAGCWGHRHDVLWEFDPSAVLAMGAASGLGPNKQKGYAMLLVGGAPPNPSIGDPGYAPDYTYTWSQATADGAGTNAYDPGVPQTTVCVVPSVVGWTFGVAKKMIAQAHCGLGKVTRKYTIYVKGSVLGQSPSPGKTLPAGAKVKLTVSLGPRR